MRWLVVVGALALTACATTPISPQQGAPVPAQRLYGFQQQTPLATARIVVTRDAGIRGSACRNVFYIDGTKAAAFDTAEVATFYVTPGKHIVGVGASSALCSDGLKEMRVIVQSSARVRISVDSTGSVAISPTAY